MMEVTSIRDGVLVEIHVLRSNVSSLESFRVSGKITEISHEISRRGENGKKNHKLLLQKAIFSGSFLLQRIVVFLTETK